MSGVQSQNLKEKTAVLQVKNLSITLSQAKGSLSLVEKLNFSVSAGETLALVGESGSGKSVTSLALMGLLDIPEAQVMGERWLRCRSGELISLSEQSASAWRSIRGAEMAMIFQEPMTSLNPVFTIGEQLTEALRLHQHLTHDQAWQAAKRLLDRVRIPNAHNMLRRHPHQLSGGMRQRVMIAMALSCRPTLLIADEPTTALDVTIQAQILALIRELQQELDTAVIFITHDMGVVAEMADQVTVLRRGQQLETAPVRQLFAAPQHSYTQTLLTAVPRLGAMQDNPYPQPFALPGGSESKDKIDTVVHDKAPLLQVRNLVTRFDLRSGLFNRVTRQVFAVEQVSFDIAAGETLALVGESGCGKSTTGRSILQLVASQSGSITFNGKRIDQLRGQALNRLRCDIQFIFQDPYASLDPRQSVGDAIMEPLLVHRLMSKAEARQRAAVLLERVGLKTSDSQRFPHQFSGGQRQRICIARALALEPKLVIADEAVSALDVSVQAQIINLLLDLQRERGIALLFISHDMAVVERISHRVAVMQRGQIVEIGPRQAIFTHPQHPYTQQLLAAVPVADPQRPRKPISLSTEEPLSSIYPLGQGPQPVQMVKVSAEHYVAR